MEDLATPRSSHAETGSLFTRRRTARPLDKAGEGSRRQRPADRAGTAAQMLKSSLYRSVWLPVAVAGLFLALALALLLVTSWNSVNRLQPVRRHMDHLSRLQETDLRLQEMLIDHLGGNSPIDMADLDTLREKVTEIIALDSNLMRESLPHLSDARATLGDLARDPKDALTAVLTQFRKVLALETRAHDELVAEVDRAAALEFDIVSATIIVLPALAILSLYLLRRQVLLPLSKLGDLLTTLGQNDYTPMPAEDVDPILRSLMNNYNRLVVRLAQMENENASRQETLEHQVRAAARTLLDQQRTLAAAERLAAVGEVAAGIAHELRNPLAGMQMALSNLRSDVADREHAERLDLVIAELRRITSLLNGLLEGARHTPEPLDDVKLAETVRSLLALARHQIPGNIRIDCDLQDGLDCRLPPDRLKQALLNLVVNAAEAIGDREGTITISGQRDGGKVALVVSDDGPGLPQAVLDKGGHAFVTGRKNGTGLGLAIVKRLARDLGGELQLSNAEPHGARVELRLPCRKSND